VVHRRARHCGPRPCELGSRMRHRSYHRRCGRGLGSLGEAVGSPFDSVDGPRTLGSAQICLVEHLSSRS
jgi:hypothetical protein